MHPFLKAWLKKKHLEENAVLWFDVRDVYWQQIDECQYMMDNS
jgi:hypothetical protein